MKNFLKELFTAPASIPWIITLLAMFCLLILKCCTNSGDPYAYAATDTYHVKADDTLWDIAQEYSNNSQDTYEVVSIIEDINDCTPVIHAGDVLEIPIFDN